MMHAKRSTCQTEIISSWGNVLRGEHELLRLRSRFDEFPMIDRKASLLPFGNGRSYGDSCLNVGGTLVQMRSLSRFISFDHRTGVLACESGVLLGEIMRISLPAGWMLPVVPGTQYVTVGGAIANDVHGKNHHRAGTFGRHVRCFQLLRSNGDRLTCSRVENADWFRVTIGGLGLTGLITWAELQLKAVPGPLMEVEGIRFDNIAEFFDLSAQSDKSHEYTVAWIDCLARDSQIGRGWFQRANHSELPTKEYRMHDGRWDVPFIPPVSVVNDLSLRAFNCVYYHRGGSRSYRTVERLDTFFFPLDRIKNWNRLYGPRGFYQYQCVVPTVVAQDAITELLRVIVRAGAGSFLTVLKNCGSSQEQAPLSFPISGTTLAIDFPRCPPHTELLLGQLDSVVSAASGRLYPAKDARMPGRMFQAGYPEWYEVERRIDPRISSTFWRRVRNAYR